MIKSFFYGISLLIITITYWVTTEPSHWSSYIAGIGLTLLTTVFLIKAEFHEEKILKRIEKLEKNLIDKENK